MQRHIDELLKYIEHSDIENDCLAESPPDFDSTSQLRPLYEAIATIKSDAGTLIRKQAYSEKINRALFKISNAINTTVNLEDLYASIHTSLDDILDVTNFFIALYERKNDYISFVFNTDRVDVEMAGIENASRSSSLTSEVIQTGQALVMRKDAILARVREKFKNGEVVGVIPEIWLGVPLILHQEVIGAMVVQSYSDPDRYSDQESAILSSVSDQVAIAIERKRTNEALRRSENRFRQLLHNINEAIFSTDADGVLTFISPAVRTITGYSRARLENTVMHPVGNINQPLSGTGELSYHGILYPQDRQRVREVILNAVEKSVQYGIEYRILKSNGKPTWINEKGYVRFNAAGEMRIEGVITDINERRHAEEINRTLFGISNAVNTTRNLDELYRSIHLNLGNIIDNTNFFIGLYNEEKDRIDFPYFVDEMDDEFYDIRNIQESGSLTAQVIRRGRPLFQTRSQIVAEVRKTGRSTVGTVSEVWLGVPLRVQAEVIGVMAVQSYDDPDRFDHGDIDILLSVSDQIALAIERKRSEEALRISQEQIEALSRQTEQFSLAAASMIAMKDEQAVFDHISKAIVEHSDYKCLIISYFKDAPPYRDIIGHGGLDEGVVEQVKKVDAPKSHFEEIFMAAEKLGQFSYYLPHTKSQVLRKEMAVFGRGPAPVSADAWHPEDMLFIRMNDHQGNLTGVISVDSAKSGKKPSDESVRPMEIFSSLISQIIFYKKAQEELRRAKVDAEAAARTKSEFLANMSHEIRTPMNAVVGFSELLQKTALNLKQQKYLATIQNASQLLLGVINNILDYSKIESGKLQMEQTGFNLMDIMDNLSDMFSGKAADKRVELVVSVARDVPWLLQGDPLRLRQILVNLTGNALKFTDSGEVIVTVRLEDERKGRVKLLFTVADTGIGIRSEQRSRLFESFVQADGSTTRKFGGTGLGLSICRQLVEIMGGEIWVESRAGEGSRFNFSIEFQAQPGQERKRPGIPAGLKGTRVLVVDDSAASRELLTAVLEAFRFKPLSVASGEDALDLLARGPDEPFGLILIDWMMPGLDGIETTRSIRAYPQTQSTPIVMMTAFDRESLVRQAEEAGVNAVLTKPVKLSGLLDTIMDLFGHVSLGSDNIGIAVAEKSVAVNEIAGARLLLIEDNPINQAVALEILEDAGFNVTVADNGAEAVTAVKKSTWDAVLMDIQMPGMDGYEATQRIRAWEDAADGDQLALPIIAMTAHAMKGDREKCLAAGMSDYITKPIVTRDLFNVLARWIQPIKGKGAWWAQAVSDYKGRATPPKKETPLEVYLPEHIGGEATARGVRQLKGNKTLYAALLKEFKTQFENSVARIRVFCENGDNQQAQMVLHSLKGIAGNLCLDRIAYQAHELEKAMGANIRPDSGTLLDQLDGLICAAVRDIDSLDVTAAGSTREVQGRETDYAAAGALFKRLDILIEESDLEAQTCFEELQMCLGGRAAGPHLENLEAALDRFDFEAAAQCLEGVSGELRKYGEEPRDE